MDKSTEERADETVRKIDSFLAGRVDRSRQQEADYEDTDLQLNEEILQRARAIHWRLDAFLEMLEALYAEQRSRAVRQK